MSTNAPHATAPTGSTAEPGDTTAPGTGSDTTSDNRPGTEPEAQAGTEPIAQPGVPLAPGGRRALVGRRVFSTPAARRIVYAVIFEALAIGFTTVILALMGHSAGASAAVGVVSSVVALIWNMVFNTLFERWERRSGHTGRPLWVRLVHTVLFEVGLMVFLLPAVALLLQVSLWEAFLYEAGLIIFFLVYNGVYAWCFDRVFGLPDSAQ